MSTGIDETQRSDPRLRRLGSGPTKRRRFQRLRRSTPAKVVLVLALCLLLWLADSIGRALTAPGTDSVSARLAEWARFHHLGPVVTTMEKIQYDLHPPRVGGTPSSGVPSVAPSPVAPSPGAPKAKAQIVAPSPAQLAPVALQATPGLPGEGQWQTLLTVRGQAAIRVAYLRPDSVHTSYLAGVARMDPLLLQFALHPGTEVPGGSGWAESTTIPVAQRATLAATFNSGFTMGDARGGYWQLGKHVGTLRAGAASLVFYADGHADVVPWAGPAALTHDVVAVRQNLDLIVANGQPVSGLTSDGSTRWGATLGNKRYVWRSAIGVTPQGALIYVAGNALSAESIAQLEVAAGATRAMELDINPEWTSFMTYTHPSPTQAVPRELTSDEQPSSSRYLTTSTRDFIAAFVR